MNEYIFYTPEGYTYPPTGNEDVENCQVLGREYGKTSKEAHKNLTKNHPWIKKCGFDIDETICEQLLTEETRQDIRTVIQYLIENESKHHQEIGKPQEHIYRTLQRLKEVVS